MAFQYLDGDNGSIFRICNLATSSFFAISIGIVISIGSHGNATTDPTGATGATPGGWCTTCRASRRRWWWGIVTSVTGCGTLVRTVAALLFIRRPSGTLKQNVVSHQRFPRWRAYLKTCALSSSGLDSDPTGDTASTPPRPAGVSTARLSVAGFLLGCGALTSAHTALSVADPLPGPIASATSCAKTLKDS